MLDGMEHGKDNTNRTELHPGKMIGKQPLPSGHPTVDGNQKSGAKSKKLRLVLVEIPMIYKVLYMGVSKNRGTPKWMIWGYHYFWKHPHPNGGVVFPDSLNPSIYVDVTGDPTARPHLNQIVDEVKARFHRDDLKGKIFDAAIAFKERKRPRKVDL